MDSNDEMPVAGNSTDTASDSSGENHEEDGDTTDIVQQFEASVRSYDGSKVDWEHVYNVLKPSSADAEKLEQLRNLPKFLRRGSNPLVAVYSCEFPQHNKDMVRTYRAIRDNIGCCLLNPKQIVNINKFGYETEFLMRKDYVATFKQRLELLQIATYDKHDPSKCSMNPRMSAEDQERNCARTYAHAGLRKGIKPNLRRTLAEIVRGMGPLFEKLVAEFGFRVSDVLETRRAEIRVPTLGEVATFTNRIRNSHNTRVGHTRTQTQRSSDENGNFVATTVNCEPVNNLTQPPLDISQGSTYGITAHSIQQSTIAPPTDSVISNVSSATTTTRTYKDSSIQGNVVVDILNYTANTVLGNTVDSIETPVDSVSAIEVPADDCTSEESDTVSETITEASICSNENSDESSDDNDPTDSGNSEPASGHSNNVGFEDDSDTENDRNDFNTPPESVASNTESSHRYSLLLNEEPADKTIVTTPKPAQIRSTSCFFTRSPLYDDSSSSDDDHSDSEASVHRCPGGFPTSPTVVLSVNTQNLDGNSLCDNESTANNSQTCYDVDEHQQTSSNSVISIIRSFIGTVMHSSDYCMDDNTTSMQALSETASDMTITPTTESPMNAAIPTPPADVPHQTDLLINKWIDTTTIVDDIYLLKALSNMNQVGFDESTTALRRSSRVTKKPEWLVPGVEDDHRCKTAGRRL